jgi:hypothetical protein
VKGSHTSRETHEYLCDATVGGKCDCRFRKPDSVHEICKMLPAEPTADMMDAGYRAVGDSHYSPMAEKLTGWGTLAKHIYSAMFEAAPDSVHQVRDESELRTAAEAAYVAWRDWMAGCDNGTKVNEVERAHINLRDTLAKKITSPTTEGKELPTVAVKIDGVPKSVRPGWQEVAALKEAMGVHSDLEIDHLLGVDPWEIHPLDDAASIKVQEGDEFVSHVRRLRHAINHSSPQGEKP